MPTKVPRVSLDHDPLSSALAPPANESGDDRSARLRAEAEAKRISDAIDEELNRERQERRSSRPVKVLLLGQSESGKSTTLKNFQLMNSPKAFRAEKASWRAVIQLNVVRSMRLILDAMTEAQGGSAASDGSSGGSRSRSPSPPPGHFAQLPTELLKLKMRLSPLLQVEEVLTRRLAPGGMPAFEAARAPLASVPHHERPRNGMKELSVNSAAPWKSAFNRLRAGVRASVDGEDAIDWEDPKDPGVVLNACAEDMIKLWNDPTVRELLAAQKLRLQEMAGFFLDSLDRVTAPRYVPTDDDILKARLKTLGVSEHRFTMNAVNAVGRDWRIFDVGGQRSLRAAWVPFFDDMDAIIFLAPISCFDQVLDEDPSVNRLEDSVLLWKAIVSNPLLKSTNIVLFLNKCDILREKLAAGTRVAQYIISYGDRPNDFETVKTYLRKKFQGLLKEYSPSPRPFYCHFTSVTDPQSTAVILGNVQDMVIRASLKSSALV